MLDNYGLAGRYAICHDCYVQLSVPNNKLNKSLEPLVLRRKENTLQNINRKGRLRWIYMRERPCGEICGLPLQCGNEDVLHFPVFRPQPLNAFNTFFQIDATQIDILISKMNRLFHLFMVKYV